VVQPATQMFNTSTLPSVLIAENATSNNTSVFSIKGFALPCESVGKAVAILSKHANHASKNKIANILVPGRQPALHVAALHGNIEAIESLLRGGADINHATYDTMSTALHDAVVGNQPQAVQYLLDNGANDRFVDHKGNSSLHLACALNDLECAAVLMKTKNAGKVLQLKNKRGKTPHDLSLDFNCLRLSVERGMRAFHIVVKKAKSGLKLV
jgi:ankyrin repeat protein